MNKAISYEEQMKAFEKNQLRTMIDGQKFMGKIKKSTLSPLIFSRKTNQPLRDEHKHRLQPKLRPKKRLLPLLQLILQQINEILPRKKQ